MPPTTEFVSVHSSKAEKALLSGEFLSASDIELVLKTGEEEVTVLVYDPARYSVRDIYDDSVPPAPVPAVEASKFSARAAAVISAAAGAGIAVYEVVRWLL